MSHTYFPVVQFIGLQYSVLPRPAKDAENTTLGPRKKTVWKVVPNLNTQELDNLIEDEEEYYNAVESFEHDVGIN